MTHSPSQDDLAVMLGTVLAGTYRLDAVIGEGGMGAVFRGRHLGLHRDVAVKVLHPGYARDPKLAKRFDREAHSAARLDHPNCVRVLEFGTSESGVKYMTMELLEGVELQDLVQGPFEARRAVDLVLQIVSGLEHAHSQGVVHRDLKLQNIFVTRDQEGRELLKLVDFGIAKIIHGDGSLEQMTRAGMIFGTPHYMSPEQALGLEIDARADLYSVGILLYALVAGRLPFSSDDLLSLVRMQVSTPPPQLPGSVPPPLVAIIMRLLAKQKDERFPDATALRDALERFRDACAAGNERSETLRNLVASPETSGSNSSSALPDALRPRTLSGLHTTFLRRPTPRRTLVLGGLLLLGGVALWWFL